MSNQYPTLHFRSEERPYEHRAISPDAVKALVDAGYPVNVERSHTDPSYERIFKDEEYEKAGAKLVDTWTWQKAEKGTIIIGLKELKEESFPLPNDHIQFSHCYKEQTGWQKVLSRFPRGGSVLYDLEFLQRDNGVRVAAFGHYAGFAGAALAIKNWSWQLTNPGKPLPSVETFTEGRGYYFNQADLVDQIKEDIAVGEKVAGHKPTVVIMGALGRCGRGARDLLQQVGINPGDENSNTDEVIKFDIMSKSFPDITTAPSTIPKHDILINAIYLSDKVGAFITRDSAGEAGRKLSVICDVSCDPNNEKNPIDVYSDLTTFTEPTRPAEIKKDQNKTPLSIIAIDHLPSMLPRESSDDFSNQLKETLLSLKDRDSNPVWQRAEKLFHEKVALLPENLRQKEI